MVPLRLVISASPVRTEDSSSFDRQGFEAGDLLVQAQAGKVLLVLQAFALLHDLPQGDDLTHEVLRPCEIPPRQPSVASTPSPTHATLPSRRRPRRRTNPQSPSAHLHHRVIVFPSRLRQPNPAPKPRRGKTYQHFSSLGTTSKPHRSQRETISSQMSVQTKWTCPAKME